MGKKKNKNKISGAAKTAAKTEKKLANKLKKELAKSGEEDIGKILAQIEQEEAARTAAVEKSLSEPPSGRACATLISHPINNELILFGGEYHNGKETKVYNELLFFNPVNKTWKLVKAPGGPPPRSGHYAVATSANKGELWVFGGEFISNSYSQFHHFKDLWCFSFADKKWEKVSAPNGPSPRSGHRMVLLGRKIYLFGGYNDDGRREFRYFDDIYTFCLDTRTWTKLTPSGKGPAPRSACVMFPAGKESLIIYGGFSRVRDGRSERTLTHCDAFRLCNRGDTYVWRPLTRSPNAPAPRASLSGAYNAHNNRGYVFGGINDVEETDEEIRGVMSNELNMIDLEAAKWYDVILRSTEQQKTSVPQSVSTEEPDADEPVTVVTDSVFTLKLGGGSSGGGGEGSSTTMKSQSRGCSRVGGGGPCPRMSAAIAVHRSVLYVHGGMLERDDKQFCLGDMYSLDLHKLNKWETIIEQSSLPDWLGSDSEYDSDSDDQSDSGSESED